MTSCYGALDTNHVPLHCCTSTCIKSGRSDPPLGVQTSDVRKQSCLFDLDNKFATEPGFICFDFQRPEDIPSNVHQAFDCVIIDPPFITEEVWRLYAAATQLLLAPSGR